MRRDDICLYLSPADRAQLQAVIACRNTARKLVWRAEIVLATADDCGANEIMRRANTSKPTVWRWQARYLDEGVDGLRRDKTRPSGVPAAATGNAYQCDCQDGAGDTSECHPLEPRVDGRGRGHFAFKRGAHLGGSRAEAAPDAWVQGFERPDVRGEGHRYRRALP